MQHEDRALHPDPVILVLELLVVLVLDLLVVLVLADFFLGL